MKNGIRYPFAPEVVAEIERKRKAFMEKTKVKITQPNFTKFLLPAIRNSKINLNIFNNVKKIKKKKR